MSRLSSINRRAFLGVTAALFTPAATRARNLQPTNLKDVSSDSTGSRLIVGGTDGFGLITSLGILNATGSLQTGIETPDGVFKVRTTPNDRRVVLDLIMSSTWLDLDTGEQTPFSTTTQMLIPQPTIEGPASASAAQIISPTYAFDAIYQIDIDSGSLSDITGFLQGESQSLIPASAIFGPSGALAGVWTGNNVYLLDPSAPEDAIALNAGDDSLYSTAFAIAGNEEWIAYTTYNPTDGLGEVILQSTVDGMVIPVTKGDAWSCIQFIPGDDTSFLLLHEGAIERRSIDDPTARGEMVANVGLQPGAETVTTPDGSHRLIASQQSTTDPVEWLLLDLEANTGTPLPDLDGLDLLPISPWQQQPEHALFGSRPDSVSLALRPGPITGLHLGTGEVIPLLDDVALDTLVTHTTTGTGSQAMITNHSEDPEPALWLLDLAEGTATQVTSNRDAMIGGCLAPDGNLAAVTARNADRETEILLFDPADPTNFTALGPGATLTWT